MASRNYVASLKKSRLTSNIGTKKYKTNANKINWIWCVHSRKMQNSYYGKAIYEELNKERVL